MVDVARVRMSTTVSTAEAAIAALAAVSLEFNVVQTGGVWSTSMAPCSRQRRAVRPMGAWAGWSQTQGLANLYPIPLTTRLWPEPWRCPPTPPSVPMHTIVWEGKGVGGGGEGIEPVLLLYDSFEVAVRRIEGDNEYLCNITQI